VHGGPICECERQVRRKFDRPVKLPECADMIMFAVRQRVAADDIGEWIGRVMLQRSFGKRPRVSSSLNAFADHPRATRCMCQMAL